MTTLQQMRKSCSHVCSLITVEPILMLFSLSGSLMWQTVQALTYRKVCLSNFNLTVCDNLDQEEYAPEEDVVQTITSYWFLARIYSDEIPAVLSALFYGNLSDHVSRKIALLLPIVGMVIASGIYLINAIFMSLHVWVILIGSFVSGVFGGWITCALSVFSYLSDITDKESRTVRMAAAEFLLIMGGAVGNSIGGKIMDATNFAFVLGLSFGLFILCCFYIQYYIRNLPVKGSNIAPHNRKCSAVCKDVFSPTQVKKALSVVLLRRQGNTRLYLIFILVAISLNILGGSTSWIIGYLFLKRQPLSWTQSMYGYYNGVGHLVKAFAVLVAIPIMRKKFHMNEASIVLWATGFHAIAEVIFGLSTKTWMVFVSVVVDTLHGAISVCFRSLLSLMVGPKEYGQVFATLGSMQSITVMIASAVYNSVYPLTLSIWAGLCFMVGSALLLVSMIFTGWVYVDMKRTNMYQAIDGEDARDDLVSLLDDSDKEEDTDAEYVEDQENGSSQVDATDMPVFQDKSVVYEVSKINGILSDIGDTTV